MPIGIQAMGPAEVITEMFLRPGSISAYREQMDLLDKNKEHISVHDGFSIITFWEPATKAFNAGWKMRVVYGEVKEKKYFVKDNWKNKTVYSGARPECEKYVQGNNTYQLNYSRLTIEINSTLDDKLDELKKIISDSTKPDENELRFAKATSNWIKGPVMGWLNDNKLDFTTRSKPSHHKSLVTGNLFDYEKYSAIDEEKWWPKDSPDAKLYLPLPKDEYPYTVVYSEEESNFPIKSEHLKELISLVEFTDLISFSTASKTVFPEMIKNPDEKPWDIIQRLNLMQSNDDDAIKQMAKDALAKYPDKVEEYRKGKKGVLSLFMGEVMKAGKGKVNPQMASEIVKNLLEEKEGA